MYIHMVVCYFTTRQLDRINCRKQTKLLILFSKVLDLEETLNENFISIILI